MRTRARAWAIRAAVVAVVTAAGVVGLTTPAYAAQQIVNFGLSTNSIESGQQVTAGWTVLTTEAGGEVVDVRISSNHPQVRCDGQCNVSGAQIDQDGTDFTATFTAEGIFTSEQKVRIRVTAGNAEPREAELTIRATPSVPLVRGTVTDVGTGEPVKGARVGMTDSAGTTWDNIGTDDNGNFTIPGTADKPIAAGQVRFTVKKEGIEDYTSQTFNAVANQPLTDVALKVRVLSTATPTSAPPITPTGLPTGSGEPTSAAAAPPDTGLSGFSIMLIVLGGLLVLVGIGAIVLLFLRRTDDADGPPRGPGMGGRGGPGGPGRGGPPPPGPRRPGPPDRTQPMRPGYGPPRPGAPGSRDQTMIARSPLADAPTQMHGRPGPPPQQPYGGPPGYPPPQQQGYGPPPGGYGPPPPGPGAPPGPPSGGPPGYGPPRPGHPGYDDPRQAGRQTSEGRRVDWMDD